MEYKRITITAKSEDAPKNDECTKKAQSEIVTSACDIVIPSNPRVIIEKKTPVKRRVFLKFLPFVICFAVCVSTFGSLDIVYSSDSPLCKLASFLIEDDTALKKVFIGFLIPQTKKSASPSYSAASEELSETKEGTLQPIESESENPDTGTMTQNAPQTNLSANNLSKISNETGYNVNIEELLKQKEPISQKVSAMTDESVEVFGEFSPLVLIIHTHGTECYSDGDPEGKNGYRSHDTEKNVVSVGKKLYETLSANGISAIHSEKMFDAESYINSYRNSKTAVSEYLKKYPSIKYIVDLHRDAVCDEYGNYTKVLTPSENGSIAQLMMVIGTDEAGAVHPDWENNLRAALDLQIRMSEKNSSVMRPIYLRSASFNQQLCDGYFILEAGSCANTLEEVLPSVELFGRMLSEKLKE